MWIFFWEQNQCKKHLETCTKSHNTKKCDICGDNFKSEKDINDHFNKRHENSIDPFSEKCAYDKFTKEDFCDSCLDEWIPKWTHMINLK